MSCPKSPATACGNGRGGRGAGLPVGAIASRWAGLTWVCSLPASCFASAACRDQLNLAKQGRMKSLCEAAHAPGGGPFLPGPFGDTQLLLSMEPRDKLMPGCWAGGLRLRGTGAERTGLADSEIRSGLSGKHEWLAMPSLETFRVPGRGPHKDVNVQHHYWVKQTRLANLLQQKPLEHCFTHLWPWSFLTKPRGLHRSVLVQNGLHT